MRAATAGLLVAAVLLAPGCGGSGEEDLADAAIAKAASVETMAYTGKVEMAIEAASPLVGIAASDGATGSSSASAATGSSGASGTADNANNPENATTIEFTGAADDGGAGGPRSQLDMNLQGVSVRAVAPGDGNSYVVAPAGVFGAPIDDMAATGAGVGSVLRSIRGALDDFSPANDDRTRDGMRLTTVSAKASAEEFCDRVAPAFSEYMDTASANVSSVRNLTGDAPLDAVCRRLLIDDPTLWLGVDSDGMLRMIAMQARMSLLGGSSLKLTVRFDITSYGEPVSIVKPDGATMLGSQSELRRRSAVPSGG